ncbi:MAG: peptide chain release factor N(5)-glutamine methyltransferase, partial [Patescibacteria group bacterium]
SNTTTPHLDAELLLCFALEKYNRGPKPEVVLLSNSVYRSKTSVFGHRMSIITREHLFTHPEKKLTKFQLANYKKLINKRIKGEPVAYLTNHKQFYGLDFYVNKNVLIPRPETELITHNVERITHNTQHTTCNTQHVTFIDVGTGSGCIIISIIKQIQSQFPISPALPSEAGQANFKFLALDISKPALAVARKNAKIHNVYNKIKFLHGNLLEPVILKSKIFKKRQNPPPNRRGDSDEATFLQGDLLKPLLDKSSIVNCQSSIIITANLPYLTPAQIKNSPSIKYEPKLALSAGSDGLKYYKKLFKQINVMRSTLALLDLSAGLCIPHYAFHVLCEIDQSQTHKIKKILKKEFCEFNLTIKKDLSGKNRLIIIELDNK